MSGVNDSEDLSLSCSVSSVESKELSETESGLETIEPYQFEHVVSDSAESDAGGEDDDSGDKERLANRLVRSCI